MPLAEVAVVHSSTALVGLDLYACDFCRGAIAEHLGVVLYASTASFRFRGLGVSVVGRCPVFLEVKYVSASHGGGVPGLCQRIICPPAISSPWDPPLASRCDVVCWVRSIGKGASIRPSFSAKTRFLPAQVMATNLMTLEGKQTTVAVVGLAHVDGIESILAANGWKPQRC